MLTDRLIVLSWAIFCSYWALGSLSARASIGRGRRLGRYLPMLLIVPAVALGCTAFISGEFPQHASPAIGLRILGVVLCALGVAVAIWARVCLGDNWGMPMTRRADPHLITSGPYAYVRHPIYTGILLGLTGTMLATSPARLFGWPLVALVYFHIAAMREERDMLKAFPEEYRAYMSKTRRLIPFVW